MDKLKFSIVTPAYDAGKFIGEMMESVRAQSYADWELLVTDDGSSDDTWEIIREAAASDPRIRPFRLPANSGSCFLPRRNAIERATGDYIVNIDADDTVDPDYLLRIRERIDATGADLVYADMHVVPDGKKRLPADESLYAYAGTGRDLFMLAVGKWGVPGVGAVARPLALRSLERFDTLGLASPEGFTAFDNENLTRLDLLGASKVAFAPARYFYRMVATSVTHEASPRLFGLLHADMALCRLAAGEFGEDSAQYGAAQVQLFHHLIVFLRLLGADGNLGANRTLRDTVSRAYRAIDFRAVKGRVSPRYYWLLRTGLRPAAAVIGALQRGEGRGTRDEE